jgi:hypothetical protein
VSCLRHIPCIPCAHRALGVCRSIVRPNGGFQRQLEVFERHLKAQKEKKAREEENGEGEEEVPVKIERLKVGREDVEYTRAWMRAEIVRWHARERRLELVHQHDGDLAERVRRWWTNCYTYVFSYHARRFLLKVLRLSARWTQHKCN